MEDEKFEVIEIEFDFDTFYDQLSTNSVPNSDDGDEDDGP